MSIDLEWTIEGGTTPAAPEAPPDVEASEYAAVFQQLLPPGAAWAFGEVATGTSTFAKLLRGIAAEPARVENRLRDLLEELDPRTTTELLEDWERVYGLPEACGSPPTTLEGRRAALHAKMTAKGVGNVPFFLQLAANLGYPSAEIYRMNRPFRCGSRCGDSLYGTAGGWQDAFLLLANATTENDGTLQCLVQQYAQTHEIALFEAPGSWAPPEE